MPRGQAEEACNLRPKDDILIVLRPTIWRFPKIEVPLNHPFDFRIFHYKPSILGYPYLVLYSHLFWANQIPLYSFCLFQLHHAPQKKWLCFKIG